MPSSTPSAIFLASQEPSRLADFYRDVLELSPGQTKGDSLGMSAGPLHLGFERLGTTDTQRTTVWFDVADMSATLARIVERGGRVVAPPDSTCSPGEVLCTAEDIDGNRIGLIARSPNADRPGES